MAVAVVHEPAKEHSQTCLRLHLACPCLHLACPYLHLASPCLHLACQSCHLPCSASLCYLDAAGGAGYTLAAAFGGLDMAVGALRAVVVGMLQGLGRLVGQLAAGSERQLGLCCLQKLQQALAGPTCAFQPLLPAIPAVITS